MFNQINKILGFSDKLNVVQVVFADQVPVYNALLLEKKVNDINITQRISNSNFTDILTQLNNNNPLVIAFSGKGIVSRKFIKEADFKSGLIFNASEEDFYFDVTEIGEFNFVSYARREILDSIMEEFRKREFFTLDFTLGPFNAQNLFPFVNSSKIEVAGHELLFEEGRLRGFAKIKDKTDASIRIENELLNPNESLMFSVGLTYFLSKKSSKRNEALIKNRETLRYKKGFKILGIFLLGFFITSLLISRILMSVYNEENLELQQKMLQQQHAYGVSKKLIDSKKQKEKILNATGVFNTHFLSYYVFKTLESMPDEVKLESTQVFPLTEKVKPGKKIEPTAREIKVTGNVFDSEVLGKWIDNLNKLPWVEKVNITLGVTTSRSKDKTFQLDIMIKNGV